MAKNIDLNQPEIRHSLLRAIARAIFEFNYDVERLRKTIFAALKHTKIGAITVDLDVDALMIKSPKILGVVRFSRLELERLLLDEKMNAIRNDNQEANAILSAWKNNYNHQDLTLLLNWLLKEQIIGWRLCSFFDVYKSDKGADYTANLFGDELLMHLKASLQDDPGTSNDNRGTSIELESVKLKV